MYTAWAQGQTDGGDAGAESNRKHKSDDGEVILHGVWIVAGMPHKGDRQHAAIRQKPFPKIGKNELRKDVVFLWKRLAGYTTSN
jgi:hypothetical protein